MIVLDEQLLGRGVEDGIAGWYRGAVRFITDLRPESVIKDDAIPALLRKQNQPTFVTLNERDFWRRTAIDQHFCIVCFALPDSRAQEIPSALRSLLRRREFRTKAMRMGKVVRVGAREVSYYAYDDGQLRVLTL